MWLCSDFHSTYFKYKRGIEGKYVFGILDDLNPILNGVLYMYSFFPTL